jgi:signal transduction histidine kinase
VLRHRFDSSKDSEGLAHVDAAQRGVQRLSALIANLLDASRLDRGLFALEPEPIDLAALASESAAALATPEHEILVRASEPVVVAADAPRLRQCLDNLLSNATTHSPRHAPVSVMLQRMVLDGTEWGKVEIVDEGPGIPQEILPNIFDRFVSGRADEGGLGLGLYLARRIATAHGGDLTVESSPGKGARFVLRLPLYEEPRASERR